MGQIRSPEDWTGKQIGGVILGEPMLVDGMYVWDGAIPDGDLDDDGVLYVTVDEQRTVADVQPVDAPVELLPDDMLTKLAEMRPQQWAAPLAERLAPETATLPVDARTVRRDATQ
jgi:hypothetical protein